MAIPGEIIQATIEYQVGASSTPMNVFHWIKASTNTDATDMDTIVDWVDGNWGSSWAALAHTAIELVQVTVRVLNGLGTVIRILGSENINVFGDVASTTLPAANAGLMVANTAEPSLQGKKYVPGLSEGTVEAGVITTGALADLANLMVEYLTPIDLVTPSLVTMIPGIYSTAKEEFFAFNGSGTITNVPAYQRRRKPGVGI